MNPHVTEWLSAYHDGELRGERLGQVETHLAACAACRDELGALQRLSAVLRESPALLLEGSPQSFVGQVLAGLPARRPPSSWRTPLVAIYALLPALLVGAWIVLQLGAFAYGLAWISPIELDTIGFEAGGLLLAWMVSLGAGGLPGGLGTVLNLGLGGFGSLGQALSGLRFTLLYLAVTAVIAVLLWSWLVGWWAYHRHLQLEPQGRLEKEL